MKRLFTCVSMLAILAGCNAKPAYEESYTDEKVSVEMIAPAPLTPESREQYDGKEVSSIIRVADQPVSTFAIDVDTGAYANVRRMLNQGLRPPAEAVRAEEVLNYFRYDYPAPADRSQPFSVTTNISTTPWNPDTRLLRIGLRAYDVARKDRPAANLVFLIDVSGSMDAPDKLPLVKHALNLVADQMRKDDKVSIVVYAGAAGRVLSPTSNPRDVRNALSRLGAGGSTAGGEGIALAYETAREAFIKGGINRVILASDGDFNVGITDTKDVETLVKQNKDDGITLTTLGFGEGNFNDELMEHIADVGNGNYAYIDNAGEARKVLDDELSSTLFTVAQDGKIQVEFNPAEVSQYRLIGYENRALTEAEFRNDRVDAGDIGAGHQVTAIYEIVPIGGEGWIEERRYDGNTAKPVVGKAGELAMVRMRYKLPGAQDSRLIECPILAADLKTARTPTGDMAFAIGVAAYAQILRGDTNMGHFKLADIRSLAGPQSDYRRQEFLELTRLAESAKVTD